MYGVYAKDRKVSMLQLQGFTKVEFRSLLIVYADDTYHYSCSLVCFKAHEAQCFVDETKPSSDILLVGTESGRSLPSNTPSAVQQVQQLFSDHPDLRNKLKHIYEASLDPSTVSDSKARRHNSGWSEDKGFSHALELLRRQASGPEGADDLKAFTEFVRRNDLADP